MLAKLVKGQDLNDRQIEEVKAQYIHRHYAIGPGKFYPDFDAWLRDHAFYIRKDGRIANTPHHCVPAFMADWR